MTETETDVVAHCGVFLLVPAQRSTWGGDEWFRKYIHSDTRGVLLGGGWEGEW